MRLVLLVVCIVLCSSVVFASSSTYFYAGNKAVAIKDTTDDITYVYQDRLGSDTNTKSLPFGQIVSSDERFAFTSKEHDAHGMYYFGARYYDSSTGRFLSVDKFDDSAYPYVRNNPFLFIDPDGNKPILALAVVDDMYSDLLQVVLGSINPESVDDVFLSVYSPSSSDVRSGAEQYRSSIRSLTRQIVREGQKGSEIVFMHFLHGAHDKEVFGAARALNIPQSELVDIYSEMTSSLRRNDFRVNDVFFGSCFTSNSQRKTFQELFGVQPGKFYTGDRQVFIGEGYLYAKRRGLTIPDMYADTLMKNAGFLVQDLGIGRVLRMLPAVGVGVGLFFAASEAYAGNYERAGAEFVGAFVDIVDYGVMGYDAVEYARENPMTQTGQKVTDFELGVSKH